MLDRPRMSEVHASVAAAAPLLMLPGTLCDARIFSPVLSRLDRRAYVLPLAGASTAADLAGLVLAAAPDRFCLCGFSLGAIVALEIVARAPRRVERLALIGCNPGVLEPDAIAARAALTPEAFLAAEAGPHRPVLEQMAAATSPEIFAQQTAITLSRRDSRPRLPAIAVPALVLCGADDRICPPGLSRDIAAAVPLAHLAVIEGAGHYVTLERPEQVATELAAWLARPANTLH